MKDDTIINTAASAAVGTVIAGLPGLVIGTLIGIVTSSNSGSRR